MGWGKMIMTGIVIEKILEMFILMLVGVIVYKAKVVDETISKNLSNLLLMVVTPLLILKTYQTDFNMELFQGLLITLAASAVTFFVFMALAAFLFPGKRRESSAGTDRNRVFQLQFYRGTACQWNLRGGRRFLYDRIYYGFQPDPLDAWYPRDGIQRRRKIFLQGADQSGDSGSAGRNCLLCDRFPFAADPDDSD